MPGWDTGDAFIDVVVNPTPVFEVATTLLNFCGMSPWKLSKQYELVVSKTICFERSVDNRFVQVRTVRATSASNADARAMLVPSELLY